MARNQTDDLPMEPYPEGMQHSVCSHSVTSLGRDDDDGRSQQRDEECDRDEEDL